MKTWFSKLPAFSSEDQSTLQPFESSHYFSRHTQNSLAKPHTAGESIHQTCHGKSFRWAAARQHWKSIPCKIICLDEMVPFSPAQFTSNSPFQLNDVSCTAILKSSQNTFSALELVHLQQRFRLLQFILRRLIFLLILKINYLITSSII